MIPNIIHFNYGMKEQKEEFLFSYLLAIVSAYYVNKPIKIYFHYHYLPYGKWWDACLNYITPNKVPLPEKIKDKDIKHYAHKSDIVRMEALLKYGGIHFDIDTISLRPVKEYLQYDMVMAREKDYGLCNAVIMANKDSKFLKRWWEIYPDWFIPDGWGEASIVCPRQLSNVMRRDIVILNGKRFFEPDFNSWCDIFNESSISIPKELLTLHLWENSSYNVLKGVDINYLNGNSLYCKIVRELCSNHSDFKKFLDKARVL